MRKKGEKNISLNFLNNSYFVNNLPFFLKNPNVLPVIKGTKLYFKREVHVCAVFCTRIVKHS